MSELREECYKCLNNQSCPGAAEYGSIMCMTRRKFKMPRNEEDGIYAHKFAIMQKQIDEKDARIKELELKQKEMCEEYCPKAERIKELEEENKIFELEGSRVKLKLYIEENYIPVQKVKDKIEELKKDYEDSKDENGETEYYYPDYTIRKLEELLEDK